MTIYIFKILQTIVINKMGKFGVSVAGVAQCRRIKSFRENEHNIKNMQTQIDILNVYDCIWNVFFTLDRKKHL